VLPKVTVSGDGRMLLLTRTGLSISLSLATLDAVGLIKLDALLRRTGAGELGTATAFVSIFCLFFFLKNCKTRGKKTT
jgi:hypothetical protein